MCAGSLFERQSHSPLLWPGSWVWAWEHHNATQPPWGLPSTSQCSAGASSCTVGCPEPPNGSPPLLIKKRFSLQQKSHSSEARGIASTEHNYLPGISPNHKPRKTSSSVLPSEDRTQFQHLIQNCCNYWICSRTKRHLQRLLNIPLILHSLGGKKITITWNDQNSA